MGRIKQNIKYKNNNQKPNTIFIVENECGLLEFLLLNLKNKSRNNVKSLLSHREVFVDSKAVTKYDYELKIGQKVEINWNVSRDSGKKDMLDIIYEDNDIIAVNKPAGLLSISTEKENERTAYHMLMEYVKSNNPKNRIYVVHRLDRDTSGVLIVAKNENMKHLLQDNWSDIVRKRGYVALVEGKIEKKSGTIKSWLKETKTHFMYSSEIDGVGQEAITEYNVLSQNDEFSLVDIDIKTGRKNQIRVHMKDIGHCIAGDKKYGAQTNPLKRLCLHANILEFNHPVTGETVHFETEIPKNFIHLSKNR